jgi:uncharacterized protein (DUF2062 family)
VLRKLYHRARDLGLQALREHTTPRELAFSVGLGVLIGCTPFIGFHIWIALGLATLFRLNRVWAMVGSRVSFFLVFPWIVLAEIQLAHRVRTGHWAPITAREVMDHRGEYLLDWSLGVVPVGLALALAVGSLAYLVARWRTLTPRMPSPAPPPSSGSPP